MEEKEYLRQIDDLHQWLLNEPNGRYEHGQLWEPDGDLFASKAEQLLNLVHQLKMEHHPDYISIIPQHIGSLLNHEIAMTRISYDKANRPKARRKDKDFFTQSLHKANNELSLHLNDLFEHIDDLEKNV